MRISQGAISNYTYSCFPLVFPLQFYHAVKVEKKLCDLSKEEFTYFLTDQDIRRYITQGNCCCSSESLWFRFLLLQLRLSLCSLWQKDIGTPGRKKGESNNVFYLKKWRSQKKKSEGVNRYYSWNKLFRLNYFEAAKLMKRETMTPDKITKWEFCNSSSRREWSSPLFVIAGN